MANTTDKIKSTVSGGILKTIELEMPQFSDSRKRIIRVWIPDGYDKNDSSIKYPVLYMHDGQNLFDEYTSFVGEWHVDESLTDLFAKGFDKIIVVGIDNGGMQRFNELSPEWTLNARGMMYIDRPVGSKYADFVMNTVKPYIDEHYNTKPEREFTGIGGSSMGGVMSYYMSLKYADKIGYGLILSPAVHLYEDAAVEAFTNKYANNKIQTRMYIYAGGALGGAERGTAYDETLFTRYVDILKKYLIDNGYSEENIGTKTDMNKSHSEACWAEVFPESYEWAVKR